MGTPDLLTSFRRQGFRLVLEGDTLRVSPKGLLTPELRAAIAGHKAQLAALLAEEAQPPAESPLANVPPPSAADVTWLATPPPPPTEAERAELLALAAEAGWAEQVLWDGTSIPAGAAAWQAWAAAANSLEIQAAAGRLEQLLGLEPSWPPGAGDDPTPPEAESAAAPGAALPIPQGPVTLLSACEAGFEAEQKLHELRARIERGRVYVQEHPDDRKAGALLRALERRRPALATEAERALRRYEVVRAIVAGFDLGEDDNVSDQLMAYLEHYPGEAQLWTGFAVPAAAATEEEVTT